MPRDDFSPKVIEEARMDKETATVVAALIGATASILLALFAYAQGMKKVTQDLQVEYDKDLRSRRIRAYSTLMKEMRVLAKYPSLEPLPCAGVLALAKSFSDWYYCEGGGLVLSTDSRDRYFDLQDGLKIVLDKHTGEWPKEDGQGHVQLLREHLGHGEAWQPPLALCRIAQVELVAEDGSIRMEVMEQLYALASQLRTCLTNDVHSRQRSILGEPAV